MFKSLKDHIKYKQFYTDFMCLYEQKKKHLLDLHQNNVISEEFKKSIIELNLMSKCLGLKEELHETNIHDVVRHYPNTNQ